MKNKRLFAIIIPMILAMLIMSAPQVTAPTHQSSTEVISQQTEVSINWTEVWQDLNKYTLWDLEYYEAPQWINIKSDLTVQREFTALNRCKITLIFDASHSANYRLTLAINKIATNYINRTDKHQFTLNYTDVALTFDWSDIISIPNLQISKGILDGYFWFRIRRDGVQLGAHIEIDPYIILYSQSTTSQSRGSLRSLHPSSTTNRSAIGENVFITTSAFMYVSTFTFDFYANNMMITSRVYENGNSSSGNPIGSPLTSSSAVNMSIYSSGRYAINFTFDSTYLLQNNYWYFIDIEVSSYTDGYVTVRGALTGAHQVYYSSAWHSTSGGLSLIIYGYLFSSPPYCTFSLDSHTTTTPRINQTVWHNASWLFDALVERGHYIFSYGYNNVWYNDSAVAFGATDWSNVSKSWNLPLRTVVCWRIYANDTEGQWGVSPLMQYEIQPAHGLITGYAIALPYIGAGMVIGFLFMIYSLAKFKKTGSCASVGMVILTLMFMFSLLMLYVYMYYIGQFSGI